MRNNVPDVLLFGSLLLGLVRGIGSNEWAKWVSERTWICSGLRKCTAHDHWGSEIIKPQKSHIDQVTL